VKRVTICLLILVSLSCQKEKEVKPACTKESSAKEKKFEMYQMSEMATLMEQMYVDNQRLKDRIIKGEAVGDFPQHFLKIHTAVMTDDSDNDAFFKEQAAQYINAQQLIYKDPKNAKEHFNKGVDACLSCHQEKCGGPIPKIKKLYIK
jgi:cytochrome c553